MIAAVMVPLGAAFARAASVTEFAVPGGSGVITAAPNGGVWFANSFGVGHISPSGRITRYYSTERVLPAGPDGIAVGREHALWLTESLDGLIARIAPTGRVTKFALEPSPEGGGAPGAIAQGPEGNLWFTELPAELPEGGASLENERVGRITPSGAVSLFSTGAPPEAQAIPMTRQDTQITTGEEGDLWFTEKSSTAVSRVAPDGVVSQFLRDRPPQSQPEGLAVARDGSLWFAEPWADRIGHMATSGSLVELPTRAHNGAGPFGIALARDGTVWFTEPVRDSIGAMTASGKVVGQIALGDSAYDEPEAIVAGTEGDLWFTLPNRERIARVEPNAASTPLVHCRFRRIGARLTTRAECARTAKR